MNYKEVQMDLFDVPDEYYLAHCISSDCTLGSGIAVEFQKRYKLRGQLLSMPEEKRAFPKCIKIGRVFNLITKERGIGKPTYESLEMSLALLKNQIVEENIKHLAIPKIGCGLDRLNWDIVRQMVKKIFIDVDIDIIMCYL